MSAKGNRKITTIHFGELEITPELIYVFPEGLLGFEGMNEFVLVSEEETEPFKWLISLDEPNIGFPLLNPWFINIKYNPGKKFNADKEVIFSVVTLGNGSSDMTANLKAPIILDIDERKGRQIILPSDKYSPNYIISPNKEKTS